MNGLFNGKWILTYQRGSRINFQQIKKTLSIKFSILITQLFYIDDSEAIHKYLGIIFDSKLR